MHFFCNQLSKVIVICFLLGTIVLLIPSHPKILKKNKVNNAGSVYVFLAILLTSYNGRIEMARMALGEPFKN